LLFAVGCPRCRPSTRHKSWPTCVALRCPCRSHGRPTAAGSPRRARRAHTHTHTHTHTRRSSNHFHRLQPRPTAYCRPLHICCIPPRAGTRVDCRLNYFPRPKISITPGGHWRALAGSGSHVSISPAWPAPSKRRLALVVNLPPYPHSASSPPADWWPQ
jgi:hypothetical protein